MGINRRNFFKVLGATGMTLSVGGRLAAAPEENPETEFKAMLYDATRCLGCRGCEWDCALENNLPEPEMVEDETIIRKTDSTRRSVINMHETSIGPVYAKDQCMHCNDPACASACLTNAMKKTPEGPVTWDGDKCMGCRYCMISCPFDVPKFEYESTNPKIVKCSMCFHLVKEGEMPTCAFNCPGMAITFGTRREIIKEARKRIHENPDKYVDHIYGEHEAGGTCWMYLSPVPFEEIGFNTRVKQKSYPELTKGFISAIAPVDILLPALLLGIHEATKPKKNKEEEK